jgi:hypothetical protein
MAIEVVLVAWNLGMLLKKYASSTETKNWKLNYFVLTNSKNKRMKNIFASQK